MILDDATCTAAAGVAVQDRLAGEPEWLGSPARWAERSEAWQLAYRTVFYDGPVALGVRMVSQPEWVVWGLSTDGPTQFAQGGWEQCRSQQSAFRAVGWLTGIYRQGFEPKGLIKIYEEGRAVAHQAESTNRAIKATALVDLFDKHSEALGYELTADVVERMDDAGWQALAKLAAHVNRTDWTDASEDTRKTVVAVLRQREATPDPFQGFPT